MQRAPKLRTRRNRATLAIIAGLVVSAIFLFVPQAGASTIVQLQSPGYLRANGAAAEITVMVVCKARIHGPVGQHSPPQTATLSVAISEATRGGIASGTGKASARNGDFPCDDSSHYIQVFVLAHSRPFHRGIAFAMATLKVCSPQCHSASQATQIQLLR